MNAFFKPIFQDKITFWGFLASFFFLCLSLLAIGIFYRNLPSLLPLFNKLPWGDDRLGNKLAFFLPIGIVLIFSAGNSFAAAAIYMKNPLLARFLGITTMLISLLTCIFTLEIIHIII